MLYIRQNEAPRMGMNWTATGDQAYQTIMKHAFQVEGQDEIFKPGDLLLMEWSEEDQYVYKGEPAPVEKELIPAEEEEEKPTAGKRGKKE